MEATARKIKMVRSNAMQKQDMDEDGTYTYLVTQRYRLEGANF